MPKKANWQKPARRVQKKPAASSPESPVARKPAAAAPSRAESYWDRLRKNPMAVLGLLVIVSMLIGAVLITLPEPRPPTPTPTPPVAKKSYPAPPPLTIDVNKTYKAILETSKGTIVINLLPKEAPNTVNNFVFLAREGFFDGVIFHRVAKDFVIQGGDPTGTGTGGPGYTFADELPATRSYTRGIVAMANAGPNTNGSQFFIVVKDSGLPRNYSIFGEVVSGMDVVDAINALPLVGGVTDGRPVQPPVIQKVTIGEQ